MVLPQTNAVERNPNGEMKMTKQLIQLAANCGIRVTPKMTLQDIKIEHDKIRHPLYADQHDARLMEAVNRESTSKGGTPYYV